jgi:hypothetical protein
VHPQERPTNDRSGHQRNQIVVTIKTNNRVICRRVERQADQQKHSRFASGTFDLHRDRRFIRIRIVSDRFGHLSPLPLSLEAASM